MASLGAGADGGASSGAGSIGVGTDAVGGVVFDGRDGAAVAGTGLPPENGALTQPTMPSSSALAAKARAHRARHESGVEEGNIVGEILMTRGEPLPVPTRTLYVVATPIGNLRDITLRALDVLGQADVVAAEDTRVSATLASHYGISVRFISLHAHNERQRADEVIALLAADKRIALVTDAGTPAISDPGATLVRAVAEAGFSVVPIPGASAVTAALSVSGLIAPEWMFCGFLPASAGARSKEIGRLRSVRCALVLYEAPHRIAATIDALAASFGSERRIVIARELTKRFETIHRCTLGEAVAWLAADANQSRGEFVLVIEAESLPQPAENNSHDALLTALLAELPLAQSVRIAVSATGLPKNRIYDRALALKNQG
jgi:16S rRNA (cytidine1402-2'-O)-methyltransferase